MQKPRRIIPKTTPPRETQRVPWAQVSALKASSFETTDPSEIEIELRFSSKTVFGRKITFSAKPAVALTLLRWMEQAKTSSVGEVAHAESR